MRPVILDLFCCAGGSAVGYHRAGFEVVGVDIAPQPRYPFLFLQADAMSLPLEVMTTFDAIHASPPCQSYSDLAKRNGNGDDWPRLIDPVRERLDQTDRPYVIENVEGAPLRDPTVLCGTMFPELRVIRHRLFETTFPVQPPKHTAKHPLVHTFDKRKSHYGKTDEWLNYVQVTGGGNCSIASAHDAMGIDWTRLSKREINEAIPPVYSEFVGSALIDHWQGGDVGSKAQLRSFLKTHIGQVVNARQLQTAAGQVVEWARRLRELRNDDGWEIQSHHDDGRLTPGQYRIVAAPQKTGGGVSFLSAHVKQDQGAGIGAKRLHLPDVRRGSRRPRRCESRPQDPVAYRSHHRPSAWRDGGPVESSRTVQRLQSRRTRPRPVPAKSETVTRAHQTSERRRSRRSTALVTPQVQRIPVGGSHAVKA